MFFFEFGVKASIVTNNRRAPGGLFVLHARALPDNPYDGHTLRDVIGRTETFMDRSIERAYVDKVPRPQRTKSPSRLYLRPEARRRCHQAPAAPPLQPIIGHFRAEGHLGC
jgi:transposase, IS5 family